MARNKHPEVTINRILDTSWELFMEKGYEATTIQDIVNALGDLSKGAIYHHFKSKEEILDAVTDRFYKEQGLSDVMTPVSYTHLDVYKRQSVHYNPHYTSCEQSRSFPRQHPLILSLFCRLGFERNILYSPGPGNYKTVSPST